MCMYLINGNFLGQRLIGYECYESKSKGFIGMSEKQIIDKLKRGDRVYGFVLGKEDDKDILVLDTDGFNMTNLQLETGVNNLSWMNDNSDCDMNIACILYIVNKMYKTPIYYNNSMLEFFYAEITTSCIGWSAYYGTVGNCYDKRI